MAHQDLHSRGHARDTRKLRRIRQGKRRSPPTRIVSSFAAAIVIAAAAPVLAKDAPQALSDWPCETPFAGPLEPAMLWPNAPTRPEGLWQSDPAAKRLVEFLTAGENSPAMGEREIEAYAME